MEIGLVGVGTMGILVASTLVKAGYRVIACDVDPRSLQRAREIGVVPMDHPQQVAEQTDLILLVLPGPPQIEAVVAGDRGLLAGAKSGQVIIDMSTVDPETTRQMGARAEAVGVDYLETWISSAMDTPNTQQP